MLLQYEQSFRGGASLINKNSKFYTSYTGTVTIGRNVYIGPDVKFVCFTHEIGNSGKRAGNTLCGNIIVGDGTWIGCNCTILPDVTIGRGCVIGAGALVNKDCKDNCIYAGVPARKIRNLDSE